MDLFVVLQTFKNIGVEFDIVSSPFTTEFPEKGSGAIQLELIDLRRDSTLKEIFNRKVLTNVIHY